MPRSALRVIAYCDQVAGAITDAPWQLDVMTF